LTPPRVTVRWMGVGARFRGASGTPPPTGCPGKGGSGSLPLIRPCGATFPQGGRQGLLLAAAGGRGGVGAPRPTDGDMETLWGLRGHPFPGRRAVGAGHARPGGVRGHPSMVRSVGRGLDPSAGVGGSGSLRGASGTPPPTGCPGMGGSESLPLIRPCGATFPQGGRQGLLLASGTPPPTVCPGMGGDGSLPLIRPCGATFPQGGRQGLLLAAARACPLPRQLVLSAELEGQAVVPAV